MVQHMHICYAASTPEGIAVDYVSHVLYYCVNNIIGIMNLDLTLNVTLISDNLYEPRGITLDPIDG